MPLSMFILLLLPIVIPLAGILIGSTIWIYKDTKRYKIAGVNIFMSPDMWSFLVFFIWLPFFPIYLILKFTKYNKQLKK